MLAIPVALASGLLFGLGLVVSQMVNPAKVVAFLDLFGDWDPSLALVMAAAVPVTALGYALARRRRVPFCSPDFAAPTQSRIDRRLVLGAITFGIGWGLVGYCPGPALTSLALGHGEAVIFVLAMLAGMALHRLYQVLSAREG
ncbi:MAG TPA: YeeE/YedE family protein [Alphaproteobacteria bacterium]|nr:YeeE/YedE family protein [Alphaproteobacteria bacterium]